MFLSAYPKTFLRAALLLAGVLTGCSDRDDALPHHQFTAEDRQWLQGKNGDTWVFETPTGRRVRYQLYNVAESKHTVREPGLLRMRDYYHFDRHSFTIARLDTAVASPGHFVFERNLADRSTYRKPDRGGSQLRVEAYWDGYVGNPSRALQGELNFPALQDVAFQTLVVRGRTYTKVVPLTSDGQCGSCVFPGGTAFDAVYYDQQHGIVRLVTRSGAVWDRVP